MRRSGFAMMAAVCAAGWMTGVASGQSGAAGDAIDRAADEADRAAQPLTVRLFWENDATFFRLDNDTDRYYTNGTGVAVAWAPAWAEDLARKLPFGETDHAGFGVTVGQLIFTPEDITQRALIPDDRPYAGYLYAGAYLQRIDRHDGPRAGATLDHLQLDLGLIGDSSFAQDAQEFVHELLDDRDPNGWDNQLADEFTGQLTYRRKWRFDLLPLEHSRFGLDVIPELVGRVGLVHRDLGAGATLRFGYRLPDDFGPARLADPNANPASRQEGFLAYGFVRGNGRIVEHNVFLEGSNFDDSHSVPIETFFGELQLGIVASYTRARHAFELGWSTTYQSEEFEGQDGGHSFGAWTLSYRHWF